MVSTVLGPATVLLMIIGAFNACFGTIQFYSYCIAVISKLSLEYWIEFAILFFYQKGSIGVKLSPTMDSIRYWICSDVFFLF